MDKKVGERSHTFFEGFSLFVLLLLILIIIATTISTGAPLLKVIIGFSPTMITIIACLITYEETRHRVIILWALPFILTGAFFFIGSEGLLVNSKLNIEALTAVNLFLSLLYLVIFFLILRLMDRPAKKHELFEHAHRQPGPVVHIVHKPEPVQAQEAPKPYFAEAPKAPEQSIREYVASIEDKSKALNFVIGRVYSKHHKGSKQLRDRILIPPEWYNEFSEPLEDKTLKDKRKLLPIVDKIENRLKMLEMPEIEVLDETQRGLRNLIRDAKGNDRILDVLIRNDKDPVEAYHKGALEFCQKLREEIQK